MGQLVELVEPMEPFQGPWKVYAAMKEQFEQVELGNPYKTALPKPTNPDLISDPLRICSHDWYSNNVYRRDTVFGKYYLALNECHVVQFQRLYQISESAIRLWADWFLEKMRSHEEKFGLTKRTFDYLVKPLETPLRNTQEYTIVFFNTGKVKLIYETDMPTSISNTEQSTFLMSFERVRKDNNEGKFKAFNVISIRGTGITGWRTPDEGKVFKAEIDEILKLPERYRDEVDRDLPIYFNSFIYNI